MKKAVIVLPTYNEEKSIEEVIRLIMGTVKQVPQWELHVLVVDSTSEDDTAEIVKRMQKAHKNLHLIQTKKEGLGKAYVNGFSYAIDKLNPYLIFEMDADLQHEPKKIPDFLSQIEKGADFVIGARYTSGGSIPKEWAFYRKFLSVVGNLILRFGFLKPHVTDWTTGYRAIKAWIVKASLDHVNKYSGYVFQVALLDFALKQGAIVREIPIHFKDRKGGESKINSIQFMANTLWYMFTHSSFIKFIIVGGMGFILDFSIAYILIHRMDFAKPTANALSAEMAIISNFLFNNFWSFAHKRIDGGLSAFIKKLLTFNVVSSGSIFIQWLGMTLALNVFGDKVLGVPSTEIHFHSWILYKVLIIIFLIIPYSYIIYNKVIWRTRKRDV